MTPEEKINAILIGVQDLKIEMARAAIRAEQIRIEVDRNTIRINLLEDNKNKAIGFLSVLGLGATALFTWLFKHF